MVIVYTSRTLRRVTDHFAYTGDFFIEDYPKELYYTGIYRCVRLCFVTNRIRVELDIPDSSTTPSVLSVAPPSLASVSFPGRKLSLRWPSSPYCPTCGSFRELKSAFIWELSFSIVIACPLTFFICTSFHMRKLYGNAIRKEAGITKTLRKVATKNAHRAPPELQRVYKEVQGTFEKFYEETAEAFEEFLGKCTLSGFGGPVRSAFNFTDDPWKLAAPLVTHYVQDTKCLIQQSREKLLITWVLLFCAFGLSRPVAEER
jgi:phosphatidylethanolamine N-methyltransferase